MKYKLINEANVVVFIFLLAFIALLINSFNSPTIGLLAGPDNCAVEIERKSTSMNSCNSYQGTNEDPYSAEYSLEGLAYDKCLTNYKLEKSYCDGNKLRKIVYHCSAGCRDNVCSKCN